MPLDPSEPAPRVSHHAQQRCAEMGLSTKVAKRIWRRRDITSPGRAFRDSNQGVVVFSDAEPDYAIVVDPSSDRPVIMTVLFRTEMDYARDGATYRSR